MQNKSKYFNKTNVNKRIYLYFTKINKVFTYIQIKVFTFVLKLIFMINRTREIIEQLNLKKVDIAEKLGITPVGLNQLLNTEKPKLETLEKLSKAIGVPVWKLILSDDEIREVNILEEKDLSEVNGYVKVKGNIYEVHSFEDLRKLLELDV